MAKERTFVASADICGYSFATEIQNSPKVILVAKALKRSHGRSSNASIKSDDSWWVFHSAKGDNIQWCSVFRKLFIKPMRKMKMTDDELFHNVLTELVFLTTFTAELRTQFNCWSSVLLARFSL